MWDSSKMSTLEKEEGERGDSTTMAPSEEEPEIKFTYFQGVPFPGPPFDVEVLKELEEFEPEPTDIFVVTYPKCGTTWMQYIVWEIVNEGAPPPGPNKMMGKHFPFLEMTGLEVLQDLERPRLMKTHLPFQLQPYSPSAKYIYVTRNPWDCCVSYFHHMKIEFQGDKELSFSKFFDNFVQGKVYFGDFFDHVLSWYSHRDEPNILFLTYEDMSADRKGAILKVAEFLGDRYYNLLRSDEQVLDNCLKHSEFKYMKDLRMFIPKALLNVDASKPPEKDAVKTMMKAMSSVDRDNVDLEKCKEWNFFRKGVIGDWKNYFSKEQIRKFNDYIKTKVTGTCIEDMWMPCLQDELE